MPIDKRSSWSARRDVVLTILGWLAVAWVLLFVLGRLGHSLFLLTFAALLAFVLDPAIRALERHMPRIAAVLLAYLSALGGLGAVLYLVVSTAVEQIQSVIPTVRDLLTPNGAGESSPVVRSLERAGVSHQRIVDAGQRVTAQAEHLTGSLLPILQGTFSSILDVVLVLILSVYLVLDGGRLVGWLRTGTPRTMRPRIEFLLATFERIVGGYVRGQLILSTLIGVLVGGGMAVFRVPDALLLGILAFVLAFIPILGTLVSGAACVLLALTQGLLIAVAVLAYFVVMHVIEGDVLGPRIVGKALGLHPIVSILAVITGSELFGVTGALFAAPLTGIGLAILTAGWSAWKESHPEEFAAGRERVEAGIRSALDEA